MRRWTLIFLLVALVAAPVGFGGLDPDLRSYARVVFFGAVLMAVCALIGGRDSAK
ncbi:DUF1328 domain-containing protein [Frigoriglobus tundricola]|uniref:DUF1328 domain-containing protein n=1 Tax=Frigoriglobus tundricola TaxID=2774151 RepID=A0A6M5Z4Y6_9BACT|nr:DUF1328 family protein [Frigoriglobus tundricola]QJX00293.1 hypothetical protein FTUN_7918 [Frigoriglobus tundricola]